MNDTDRTHKENKLEQDITLPYLKKQLFFNYFWFLWCKYGFCTSISNDGENIPNVRANPNNLGWFLFCHL